jgi:hypothetical protein
MLKHTFEILNVPFQSTFLQVFLQSVLVAKTFLVGKMVLLIVVLGLY